jgi:hypothetical protein
MESAASISRKKSRRQDWEAAVTFSSPYLVMRERLAEANMKTRAQRQSARSSLEAVTGGKGNGVI